MRLLTLLFGVASVVWGVAVFPVFWRQSALEELARGVIERNSYKPATLVSFMTDVEAAEQNAYCRPEALRGAAVVRLRLAEDAMGTGDREEIDSDLQNLDRTIRSSLSCSPADPFLWMTLSWLDGTREGFNEDQLRFLRLSYALGPNEGWVAARRNRFALSMFERLPPDLADAALNEFARMLDSGFYDDTLALFTGPGWRLRDRLLPRLKDVAERYREAFAGALYRRGYDVEVPGIPRRDPAAMGLRGFSMSTWAKQSRAVRDRRRSGGIGTAPTRSSARSARRSASRRWARSSSSTTHRPTIRPRRAERLAAETKPRARAPSADKSGGPSAARNIALRTLLSAMGRHPRRRRFLPAGSDGEAAWPRRPMATSSPTRSCRSKKPRSADAEPIAPRSATREPGPTRLDFKTFVLGNVSRRQRVSTRTRLPQAADAARLSGSPSACATRKRCVSAKITPSTPALWRWARDFPHDASLWLCLGRALELAQREAFKGGPRAAPRYRPETGSDG
jgi:hypothetical protein